MRKDFESSISVILTAADGESVTCSAVLLRDPGYFQWNRLSLLGATDDYLRVLQIDCDGLLSWRTYENPQWPRGSEESKADQTSGSASLVSIGMANGLAISADTIQEFGELNIHNVSIVATGPGWDEQSIIHWFLPRPQAWWVRRRRSLLFEGMNRTGDWRAVKGTQLKLRLTVVSWPERDGRTSTEAIRVQVPGFEIQARSELTDDAFVAAADVLWFSLRILAIFRFRKYIAPLAEFRTLTGRSEQRWQSVKRQAQSDSDDSRQEQPVDGPADQFFAVGAAALADLVPQYGQLHAAVFGYANSFEAPASETRLTNCVEAIERLVTAFETARGLGRQIASNREWRPVATALKKSVDQLGLNPDLEVHLKRTLSSPPTLHLQNRIERMVAHQARRWNAKDRQILGGLGRMIKLRNEIVHGRLVGDQRVLLIEQIRARLVFERLFLNLVGCHRFPVSGWPHWTMSTLEANTGASDEDSTV